MKEQPSTKPRRLPLIITLIAVFLLAISVLISIKDTGYKPKPVVAIGTQEGDFDSNFESKGKWYGLCRKNSVRSVEDFRRTVAQDKALGNHFANFQWETARLEKLEKPILAYVNFRKDGIIFQKRTPIKLPAGDQYIVDGSRRVRTHCCNDFVESTPILESKNFENPNPESPLSVEPPAMETPNSVVASAPFTNNAGGSPLSGIRSEFTTMANNVGDAAGTVTSNVGGAAGTGSAPPILASSINPIPKITPPLQGDTPNNPPGTDKPKDPPPGYIDPRMPNPPIPIPEPSTMPLVGIGIAILLITFLFIKYFEWKNKAMESTESTFSRFL
jgi:hypothetical protein